MLGKGRLVLAMICGILTFSLLYMPSLSVSNNIVYGQELPETTDTFLTCKPGYLPLADGHCAPPDAEFIEPCTEESTLDHQGFCPLEGEINPINGCPNIGGEQYVVYPPNPEQDQPPTSNPQPSGTCFRPDLCTEESGQLVCSLDPDPCPPTSENGVVADDESAIPSTLSVNPSARECTPPPRDEFCNQLIKEAARLDKQIDKNEAEITKVGSQFNEWTNIAEEARNEYNRLSALFFEKENSLPEGKEKEKELRQIAADAAKALKSAEYAESKMNQVLRKLAKLGAESIRLHEEAVELQKEIDEKGCGALN